MVTALFNPPSQAKEAFDHIVHLIRVVPLSLDYSVFVRSWCVEPPAIPTICRCSSFGCAPMIGIGLDGVVTSSHSTFFITNSRNARAVKIMNQLKSNTRSVQARIVCVSEKLVVVTFIDTSPFIQFFKNKINGLSLLY